MPPGIKGITGRHFHFPLYANKDLIFLFNPWNELHNVSMPYVGLTPFLHDLQKRISEFLLVSMPYIGLTPFLRYPFRNPLFMRLPRPIFASNSQNILKTRVFRPFFGLFCNHSLIALIIMKKYSVLIYENYISKQKKSQSLSPL